MNSGTATLGGLSRSPKTKNVFVSRPPFLPFLHPRWSHTDPIPCRQLKSTTASPPHAVSTSDMKNTDLPTLIRWLEGVDQLVKSCATGSATSIDSVDSESAIQGLRAENQKVSLLYSLYPSLLAVSHASTRPQISAQYQQAMVEIASLTTKNGLLKTAYEEMAASTRDLYDVSSILA